MSKFSVNRRLLDMNKATPAPAGRRTSHAALRALDAGTGADGISERRAAPKNLSPVRRAGTRPTGRTNRLLAMVGTETATGERGSPSEKETAYPTPRLSLPNRNREWRLGGPLELEAARRRGGPVHWNHSKTMTERCMDDRAIYTPCRLERSCRAAKTSPDPQTGAFRNTVLRQKSSCVVLLKGGVAPHAMCHATSPEFSTPSPGFHSSSPKSRRAQTEARRVVLVLTISPAAPQMVYLPTLVLERQPGRRGVESEGYMIDKLLTLGMQICATGLIVWMIIKLPWDKVIEALSQ